jgi:hypothetical protein
VNEIEVEKRITPIRLVTFEGFAVSHVTAAEDAATPVERSTFGCASVQALFSRRAAADALWRAGGYAARDDSGQVPT